MEEKGGVIHNSTFEHRGWLFQSNGAAMLNSDQMEAFAANTQLSGSLPECIFGDNYLELKNIFLNVKIIFTAQDALMGCLFESPTRQFDEFHPSIPQVKFAEMWQASHSKLDAFSTRKKCNYDWTFTTGYRGNVMYLPPSEKLWPVDLSNSTENSLPLARLTDRNDPILWFTKNDFWLDDLSDCGLSQCTCRIRVHETYFYILHRFEMRVDFVLIRQVDTRIFHDFDSNSIIREFTWKEVDYSTIEARKKDQRNFEECFTEEDIKIKHVETMILSPSSSSF